MRLASVFCAVTGVSTASLARFAPLVVCAWFVGIVSVATVQAASEAGKLVGAEGSVKILRDGKETAGAVNAAILVGDRIVTGTDGRARLLFADGSTVSLGESSDFHVDEHVFDPSAGKIQSTFELLQGKLRAIVSDYYSQPAASYVVKTPGAVSGVRGTDFIVEHHAETTSVVGLSGKVSVRGVRDASRREVFITENTATEVRAGRAPGAPRTLTIGERARYLEGLQLSGAAAAANAIAADGLTSGREIPESEQPSQAPPPPVAPKGLPRATTPGDAAGQPIPAIEGAGGIGVPF